MRLGEECEREEVGFFDEGGVGKWGGDRGWVNGKDVRRKGNGKSVEEKSPEGRIKGRIEPKGKIIERKLFSLPTFY